MESKAENLILSSVFQQTGQSMTGSTDNSWMEMLYSAHTVKHVRVLLAFAFVQQRAFCS